MRFEGHWSSAPLSRAIVALAFTTAACIPATAQTESVVYGFQGGLDGAQPVAGLIADKAGNLYGTTAFGGAADSGTVYELTNAAGSWSETVLYTFQGGTDGAYPYSTLVFDESGNLYGTTLAGGTTCFICGTVFKLTNRHGTWTESLLHSFSGLDGENPYGSLHRDSAGNLYGTAYSGGTSFAGTVYKLTAQDDKHKAPWPETVLYGFTGEADGGYPLSDVVGDQSGKLYGTTTGGGADGFGAVFQLTPPRFRGAPWTETAIYSFTGGSDGAEPYDGVVFDKHGNLVGAAALGGDPSCSGGGCGTVYQLTPPPTPHGRWSESTLYAFTGGLDGAHNHSPNRSWMRRAMSSGRRVLMERPILATHTVAPSSSLRLQPGTPTRGRKQPFMDSRAAATDPRLKRASC